MNAKKLIRNSGLWTAVVVLDAPRLAVTATQLGLKCGAVVLETVASGVRKSESACARTDTEIMRLQYRCLLLLSEEANEEAKSTMQRQAEEDAEEMLASIVKDVLI